TRRYRQAMQTRLGSPARSRAEYVLEPPLPDRPGVSTTRPLGSRRVWAWVSFLPRRVVCSNAYYPTSLLWSQYACWVTQRQVARLSSTRRPAQMPGTGQREPECPDQPAADMTGPHQVLEGDGTSPTECSVAPSQGVTRACRAGRYCRDLQGL